MAAIFLVLLAVLPLVSGLPIPASGDAHHLFDLLPKEIRTFYKSLTEQDLRTLERVDDKLEIVEQNHDVDGDEVLGYVKNQDGSLGERLTAMYDALERKLERLSEAPRKFMNEMTVKFENVIESDDSAHEIIEDVRKAFRGGDRLSQSAKQEIVAAFPSFKQFLE